MRQEKLSVAGIKTHRLPGVAMGQGGNVGPLYSTDAASSEVTHYLIETLDEAIGLLSEARTGAGPDLRRRIDEFIERV
jgi:hypothetical protein